MYIYFDEKVKTRDELQRRRDRGIYVYIYIYTTSGNSVPMTHIRSQREAASRGNDDFSETGVFYYRDQNTPQIYIRVMQYI